jgi:hypothetical protein
MFIRRKVVRGVTYYAVVQNCRTGSGRVKQRTVVSLGQHSTIAVALRQAREWRAIHQENAERGRRQRRNGIFLFQDVDTGRLLYLPVGETAQKRVDKFAKQIEKLEAALTVVSKTVAARH